MEREESISGLRFVKNPEPSDESVKGVLATGKGVCRHFSNVLVTLGRSLQVPMLDAWAPYHNLRCVWIHGAGWVFLDPTINITSKNDKVLSGCRWFSGLPWDELTTGVGGPALQGDLLVDGVPFVPGRHCRFPKDLPGFRNQVEWQVKNKNDKQNANPMFFALLQVRRSGDEIRLKWEEAVDLEQDNIEYLVEARSVDGQLHEVGRTKRPPIQICAQGKGGFGCRHGTRRTPQTSLRSESRTQDSRARSATRTLAAALHSQASKRNEATLTMDGGSKSKTAR